MVAENRYRRLGGAGVGAAVQQEQGQPAHDQEDRANAQPEALPRGIVRSFIIHGKMPLISVAQTRLSHVRLHFE
jgi:hypothetical protein